MSEAAAAETAVVQPETQEVRDNAVGEEGEIGFEFEPLFDDEGPQTEEGLTGEDPDKKPETEKPEEGKEPQETGDKPDEKAADSEPEGKKEGDDAEPAEKKDETAEEEPEKGAPPKGYVEIGALKEERGKHKETKQAMNDQARNYEAEISRLQTELELAQQAPADRKEDIWKDFKPLSQKEFEDLVDEDPDAAMKYQRKEQIWKEHQFQKRRSEEVARQRKAKVDQAINSAMDEIEEILPGLYTADTPPEAAREMGAFATEKGKFPTGYLAALTRPDTQLIVKGANGKSRTVVMGPAAASVVRLIHGFQEASKVNPESLRAEVEKEVTDRITQEVTEKVTRELTLKFTGKEPAFRSVSDAPRGKDNETVHNEPMTEADWAKQSPEERRRLLGG